MHKPMESWTLDSQRHHSMMHNRRPQATGRQLHLGSHTGRLRALDHTSILRMAQHGLDLLRLEAHVTRLLPGLGWISQMVRRS